MRDAVALAVSLVLMDISLSFMGLGKLFKGYWGMIFRHYGVYIGVYFVCLFVFLVLLFGLMLRNARNLRVTGSKISRVERELQESGILKNGKINTQASR